MTDEDVYIDHISRYCKLNNKVWNDYIKTISTKDLISIVRAEIMKSNKSSSSNAAELKSRANNSEDKLLILLEYPEIFTLL